MFIESSAWQYGSRAGVSCGEAEQREKEVGVRQAAIKFRRKRREAIFI
jgi:hypothetical protein